MSGKLTYGTSPLAEVMKMMRLQEALARAVEIPLPHLFGVRPGALTAPAIVEYLHRACGALKARVWSPEPGHVLVALVEHGDCPEPDRTEFIGHIIQLLKPQMAAGVQLRVVCGHVYCIPAQYPRGPTVLAEATRDELEELFGHFEKRLIALSRLPDRHRTRQQSRYYATWIARVEQELAKR